MTEKEMTAIKEYFQSEQNSAGQDIKDFQGGQNVGINPYYPGYPQDSRCPGCGRCKDCGHPYPVYPQPTWTIPNTPWYPVTPYTVYC